VDAIATSSFGLIQRIVGTRNQCGLVGIATDIEAGDTKAGGDTDLTFDASSQAFGQILRFFATRWRDQREFFAAIARSKRVVANGTAQLRADPPQDVITSKMTIGVVVGLEMVDIQHQHGEWSIDQQCACELFAQDLVKMPTIGQPGQAICLGEGSKALVGCFQLRQSLFNQFIQCAGICE